MAYCAQFKGFIFTANVHSLASVGKADFPGGYGVLSWEEAIEIMVALRLLRSPPLWNSEQELDISLRKCSLEEAHDTFLPNM